MTARLPSIYLVGYHPVMQCPSNLDLRKKNHAQKTPTSLNLGTMATACRYLLEQKQIHIGYQMLS